VLRTRKVNNAFNAFGTKDWEWYFGTVGKVPSLPPNLEEILNTPCPFWGNEGKKVSDTHLLTLIPETVNGNPLTLDSLRVMVQHPREGPSTQYFAYSDEVKKEFGGVTQSSHWALMTKDVHPESRFLNDDDHYDLVASYAEKTGFPFEMPPVRDAAVSILMHFAKTKERLFPDNQQGKELTFTRCQEAIDGGINWMIVGIGSFSPEGNLRIGFIGAHGLEIGVAGFWKL